MVNDDPPNRPVKTAARVFEVVKTIQAEQPATFTQLAKRVELAESTLHDYLTTLVHLGYLSTEDDQYRLSLQFFDHGIAARDSFSVFPKSIPTLEQLAAESGAGAWLTVAERGKVVYLARELGENSIETHERLGKHEYMHCLASGKVMLAFSSDEYVEDVVDTHGLPEQTPNSITTREELRTELSTIRDQGYAINYNEMAEGTSAVAAPIVVEDHLYGAIAIAAPLARVENLEYRERLIELVTAGANEIELRLEYE